MEQPYPASRQLAWTILEAEDSALASNQPKQSSKTSHNKRRQSDPLLWFLGALLAIWVLGPLALAYMGHRETMTELEKVQVAEIAVTLQHAIAEKQR